MTNPRKHKKPIPALTILTPAQLGVVAGGTIAEDDTDAVRGTINVRKPT